MLTSGQMSRITKEILLGLPPSNTSLEALAHRKAVELEVAEMRKQGIMPDIPCDWDDTEPSVAAEAQTPGPLNPQAKTLAECQENLAADERLWLARMIEAHGEAEVVQMWPSYCVQIEQARNF